MQLELNDVTARSSAAGRIVQGIQIRDLEAGTNSPLLSRIRVESFQLAQDDPDFFEQLVLLADVDYRGGFQMSVDALMAFGKFAKLSVKVCKCWQNFIDQRPKIYLKFTKKNGKFPWRSQIHEGEFAKLQGRGPLF